MMSNISNVQYAVTHVAMKKRMWEHSLIHNNVKPFECDLCNNQFRTKQLIKRHQYVHHNPAYKNPNRENKCSQCESSFDRKSRLKNHIASHITKKNKPANREGGSCY